MAVLEDLGNLGDFLGGIGVVITLLYLAIQIRQNTKQLRADAEAARTRSLEGQTEEIGNWIGSIAESRDVAEVWARGLVDLEKLDETDQLRFDYIGARLLQAWQSQYRRSNQSGDPETWSVVLRYVRMYFHSPGFCDLWQRSRSLYLKEFTEAIDEVASETAARDAAKQQMKS